MRRSTRSPVFQRGLGRCERSGGTAKYISELCPELPARHSRRQRMPTVIAAGASFVGVAEESHSDSKQGGTAKKIRP